MNILEKIIEHKRAEVEKRKQELTVDMLKASPLFQRQTLSLRASLLDKNKTGIIAEFKRKSPSKGIINGTADVISVTNAYTLYGASGLSVLTDEYFFGGKTEDIQTARINDIPILRKDFIIDEYQLTEARAMGADVILLIAANLSVEDVKRLAAYARSLELEVLLEIHNEEELTHICPEIDLVGVNNRNLKTFEVNINTSVRLSPLIPVDKIKISESGISEVAAINLLKEHGFKGFLIGETFMKETDPAVAFARFIQQLNEQ